MIDIEPGNTNNIRLLTNTSADQQQKLPGGLIDATGDKTTKTGVGDHGSLQNK